MELLILVIVISIIASLMFQNVVDPTQTIHWSELQTGDLLLFSSVTNPLPVTHVGLVYVDPKTKQHLCFESIYIGDFALEPHIDGVVLTPLKERLQYYDGQVSVRLLDPTKRTPEFLQRFQDKVRSDLGRPFNNIGLIALAKRWLMGPKQLRCVICSELVGETLIYTGLIPDIDIRKQYPVFMTSHSKDLSLPYGPEFFISGKEQ